MTGITQALRGIGGEFEINRVVGAFGGIVYVVGAQVFVAWNMAEGREFDLIAYCTAFPAGLAAVVAAIAGAVGWKDTKVAAAKVTERTGTIPVAAPAGPQVPQGNPEPEIEPGRVG